MSIVACPRCLAEESAQRQREHFEREEEARERESECEAERDRESVEAREREEEREAERDREREREREEDRDREDEREQEQERRHEELLKVRGREIYERNNPGDYKCPECLLISLKRGASRCPMCHAVIGRDHWPLICEAERLAKERLEAESRRKAEEWERARPERERKAAEARQKAQQAAVEAQGRAEQAAAEAQRRTEQAAAEARRKWAFKVFLGFMIPGSWVIGGFIGWHVVQLVIENSDLKVLLGVPAAGLGAIVAQVPVYHFLEK